MDRLYDIYSIGYQQIFCKTVVENNKKKNTMVSSLKISVSPQYSYQSKIAVQLHIVFYNGC